MNADQGPARFEGMAPLLQVASMSDTLDYYQSVLGFELDFVWPDQGTPKWAMVTRDSAHFMFTIDLGTSSTRFIAEKGNGIVIYVLSTSLDALYEEMVDRGAIIVQDIVTLGGRKQFSIADPNGYAIAFSEPFAP